MIAKNVRSALSAFVVVLSVSVSADTHVWVGGNHDGGGWNDPSNWTNSNGVAEAPAAGDVAFFGDPAVTVTALDADLPLACSLSIISVDAYSASQGLGGIIFSSDADYVADCAIRGRGFFRKRGAGRLVFNSENTTGVAKTYDGWGVYDMHKGGVHVDEGTLVLPQNKTVRYIWTYGAMNVAAGAKLVLINNADSQFVKLQGGGVVTNESSNTVKLWTGLQNGYIDSEMAVFSGRVSPRIYLFNSGFQAFTGEDNAFKEVYCDYGRDGRYEYGVLGVVKMGMKGQNSSLGPANTYNFMYGGNFLYLGTGETTDHNIGLDTRVAHPVTLDAGAYGGLRIEGSVAWADWGALINECWKLSRLNLAGSNAAPCTISGPIKLDFEHGSTNFTFSLVKKGTGIWAIEENSATDFGGPVFVKEGTLRFDTLAEAGELCALGRADRLVDGSIGVWNDSYLSDVAFRLGGENPAADAVLEFNGDTTAESSTRPLLLEGDGHLRASGTAASATLAFGGVSAAAGKEKTLVIDGGNTGNNMLSDVSDGEGRLSLVKDGTGKWCLDGEQSFSGDLRVKQGTLTVAGVRIHRYFRVTFWDEKFLSPYNGYAGEFALYSADGQRQNLDMFYELPAGVAWNTGYSVPSGVAAGLEPGEIAFDHIPGYSHSSAYAYNNGNELTNLCNGAATSMQFQMPLSTTKQTVAMRLRDDAQEVCYLDFCQPRGNYENKGYQTFSALKVESSHDGCVWTEVYATNDLEIAASANNWYHSPSGRTIMTNPDSRPVGDGEAVPLKVRACNLPGEDVLCNVRSFRVDPGAVFEAEAGSGVVIGRLVIDAVAGCGTIRGCTFADDVVVDIVNLPREGVATAVDLSGIGNLAEVVPTFTVNGKASARYSFKLTSRELKVLPKGLTVKIR